MDKKVVIIADVIESRESSEFMQFQKSALAKLNEKHIEANWIIDRYKVTAGDEFQVLLSDITCLPKVVWDIFLFFEPYKLRVGIGYGDIAFSGEKLVEINENATGEAFYKARDALGSIVERRREGSRASICLRWHDQSTEIVLNALFRLLYVLITDITTKQWDVIKAYESANVTQDVLAKQMGKEPSTISRSLISSRYWEIVTTLKDIETFLRTQGSD